MRGSLKARGIYKGFSTAAGVLRVIDGVDLSVAPGEFVALIGPSGCGKSTLLDILSGFQTADSGEVTADEEPVTHPTPPRILIPQRACVFPWMSAERNLHFVLRGVPHGEKQRLTDHYLELVGLEDFRHAFPYELSGGMLKRLEIARALVIKPAILFMDEPFGSLDAFTRLRLRTELRRLLTVEQHTVLLVTHDVDDALHLADRIVMLTPRPAVIQRIIDVPFPHPRALASSELTILKNEILVDLGVDVGVAVERTTRAAVSWPSATLPPAPLAST
jgi:ABC-type nitrate/sulfonate/bicarbonate transport system ATPase subunit